MTQRPYVIDEMISAKAIAALPFTQFHAEMQEPAGLDGPLQRHEV